MTIVIKELFSSIKMIKEDKVLLFLSMMPVFIGVFLYAILGGWIYTSVIPWEPNIHSPCLILNG